MQNNSFFPDHVQHTFDNIDFVSTIDAILKCQKSLWNRCTSRIRMNRLYKKKKPVNIKSQTNKHRQISK